MSNRRFFILAAASLAVAGSAQAWSFSFGKGERVTGSGESATEIRELGAFDGISLAGGFKVLVRQGSSGKVELKADKNLLSYIETKVVEGSKGRTLEIAPKRGFSLNYSTAPQLTLEVAQLRLISIAGYSKQISSFPQTVLFTSSLSDFVDASTLQQIRAQYTNANQLLYLDSNAPFTARQYRDAPGGYLRGIEANFQQNFTFLPGFLRNFGVLLNYTYIKSELNYILDPGSTTVPQTLGKGPFIGVSPQAINGTLFYEAGALRARVSVANRKSYVSQYPIAAGSCSPGLTTVGTGGVGAGTVESVGCDAPLINDFVYSQGTTNVDASVSLKLFDSFSVTLEGLNLTNQTSNRYAYQGQEVVTQYASSGRIYRLGARLTF